MKRLIIIFISSISLISQAQILPDNKDTIDIDTISINKSKNIDIKNFIVPSALIATGFAINYVSDWDKLDKNINTSIKKIDKKTHIDDGLIFVPIASVYALDWMGVKAKHDLKDRFIASVVSYAIELGSVELTKSIVRRTRPDNDGNNSFPSGHTAVAFVGAHILMKEYKHISPWIGVGGYGVATTVAFLRMMNNRHWFSDVIAGAGYGILSVELGYLLLPFLSKTFTFKHSNQESLSIVPVGSIQSVGMGLQYTF